MLKKLLVLFGLFSIYRKFFNSKRNALETEVSIQQRMQMLYDQLIENKGDKRAGENDPGEFDPEQSFYGGSEELIPAEPSI